MAICCVLSRVRDLLRPVDCHPPGSCVHGTSQARTLGGLPSLLRGLLPTQGPDLRLLSLALAGSFSTTRKRHLGAQAVERTLINDCWGKWKRAESFFIKSGHHARKIKPASRKLKKQWKHLNVNYFKQHTLLRFE